MRKLGMAAISAVGVLLLAGCAGSSRFVDAAESCSAEKGSGITVTDNDQTLVFDMKGDEDTSGGDMLELACVLIALEAPDRVTTHMSQTTSMDGRQSADWDDIEVQWSYHPNRGLDAVFVLGN